MTGGRDLKRGNSWDWGDSSEPEGGIWTSEQMFPLGFQPTQKLRGDCGVGKGPVLRTHVLHVCLVLSESFPPLLPTFGTVTYFPGIVRDSWSRWYGMGAIPWGCLQRPQVS